MTGGAGLLMRTLVISFLFLHIRKRFSFAKASAARNFEAPVVTVDIVRSSQATNPSFNNSSAMFPFCERKES